jgi:hypothetical protein
VAEPPPARAVAVANQELLVLEQVKYLEIGLGDQREVGDLERGAGEHGGLADQVPRRVDEVIDPGGDHGLDGGRKELLGERVGVGGQVRVDVPQHAEELHDEEGVAAGMHCHPLCGGLVDALAGLARERDRILGRHRVEVEVERVP